MSDTPTTPEPVVPPPTSAPPAAPTESTADDRPAASAPPAASALPPTGTRLLQRFGTGAGAVYELGAAPVAIGRRPECEVRVDAHKDFLVSGRHARITREADGLWLEDLNSSNGTWINGVRVTGRNRLFRGDRIALGAAGEAGSVELELDWPGGPPRLAPPSALPQIDRTSRHAPMPSVPTPPAAGRATVQSGPPGLAPPTVPAAPPGLTPPPPPVAAQSAEGLIPHRCLHCGKVQTVPISMVGRRHACVGCGKSEPVRPTVMVSSLAAGAGQSAASQPPAQPAGAQPPAAPAGSARPAAPAPSPASAAPLVQPGTIAAAASPVGQPLPPRQATPPQSPVGAPSGVAPAAAPVQAPAPAGAAASGTNPAAPAAPAQPGAMRRLFGGVGRAFARMTQAPAVRKQKAEYQAQLDQWKAAYHSACARLAGKLRAEGRPEVAACPQDAGLRDIDARYHAGRTKITEQETALAAARSKYEEARNAALAARATLLEALTKAAAEAAAAESARAAAEQAARAAVAPALEAMKLAAAALQAAAADADAMLEDVPADLAKAASAAAAALTPLSTVPDEVAARFADLTKARGDAVTMGQAAAARRADLAEADRKIAESDAAFQAEDARVRNEIAAANAELGQVTGGAEALLVHIGMTAMHAGWGLQPPSAESAAAQDAVAAIASLENALRDCDARLAELGAS